MSQQLHCTHVRGAEWVLGGREQDRLMDDRGRAVGRAPGDAV